MFDSGEIAIVHCKFSRKLHFAMTEAFFEVKSDDHYPCKEVRKYWPMKAFDF